MDVYTAFRVIPQRSSGSGPVRFSFFQRGIPVLRCSMVEKSPVIRSKIRTVSRGGETDDPKPEQRQATELRVHQPGRST